MVAVYLTVSQVTRRPTAAPTDPTGRTVEREKARIIRSEHWAEIDRIDRFRLGQWAAIVKNYHSVADINDDAAHRPWKYEFFFLKGAVEAGKFKPRTLKGVPHCDVTSIVFRDEITKFYEDSGRRVPALFPDERKRAKS